MKIQFKSIIYLILGMFFTGVGFELHYTKSIPFIWSLAGIGMIFLVLAGANLKREKDE